MIEKINRRNISLAFLALFLVLSQAPIALGATAFFNDNPNDLPTIQGSNYTQNPSCSSCWSSSVSADVGDTISSRVYYHNTSDTTAQNTRVRITPSLSSNGRTATVTGQVSADNAASVSGSASVNVSSAAASLTLLSTFWYPNGATSSQSVPNGSNITGSGATLGDLPLDSVGFVVARFKIEGDALVPPDVDTLSATDIGRTSALLRGEANPRGDSTEAWFEWGTSSSNLNRETSRQSIGSGSNFSSFSRQISDLDSDTTYFFRAVARNSFGTSRGEIRSFTTNRDGVTREAPLVNTFSATGIDRESARLRGEANPRSDSTRVWFEWGRSGSNLNHETSDQSIGSGNSAVEFSSSISGLDPDTTYYFRAIARNSFGTVRGDIRSFDTLTGSTVFDRPQVRALPATNIITSSASIRGEVNPNGSATNAFFEWGTNANNLINRTGTLSTGSGNSFVNISSFIFGLNSNTVYYYRVVAENNAGRSISGIESFRTNFIFTPQPPPVITEVIRIFERVEAPVEEVIKLTLEADKSNLSDNRISYIVTYENLTDRTLRDASIEVNLPDELEFDDASMSVAEVRGNTLIFRLGSIRGGEKGEIEIETTADNLREGDKITVTASLHYIDTNNTMYIIAAEDTSEITAEDLARGGLTATILDAFRGFFTNPVFWLLIGLLLLYLIYRFLTARREPPPPAGGYPSAAGPAEVQMYSVSPQAPNPPAGGSPRPPEPPPFG